MSKQLIQLDSKDMKRILAAFFEIEKTQVIPQRYSFCIEGVTAEYLEKTIADKGETQCNIQPIKI